MLYQLVKPLALLLARLLFRIEADGTEHVPRSGAVLIVSNHASVLDPPVVGAVAPRPLHFLAKAELFSIPFFGRLITALHALPLKRDGADPGALRAALRALAAGHALLIFPEGTRSPDGTLGEGKAGAGMLAVLSGAPVVPTYVGGTGRVLPPGQRIPRVAKIRVSFGPALRFAPSHGSDRRDQYRAASRQMMAAIAQLKAETEARFEKSRAIRPAMATAHSRVTPPTTSPADHT